jgi:signal transduction histidine kinase
MNPRRHKAKPGFLWQGILILLPMALLAGVGLYSLRRDRAMVLEEARNRAVESLRAMTSDLGRQAAGQLTAFDLFASAWLDQQRNGFAGWPGSEHRAVWQKDTASFERRLQEWNTTFPGVTPLEGLPLTCTFSEKGALELPHSCDPAPTPPEWFGDAYGVGRGAGREANLHAEWLKLRSDHPRQSPQQAVTNLLTFARKAWNVDSPAGLPLSTLALLEMVQRCREAGFNQTRWETIRDEIVNRPSIMTPVLLDRVAQTCAARSELVSEAAALKTVWEFQERQRAFSDLITEAGLIRGITTTNHWIGQGASRALCICSPSKIFTHTSRNGKPFSITNEVTQVRIYPRFLVERALELALAKTGVTLPAYCTTAVSLEGETFGATLPTGMTNTLLAEASVRLTQPGSFLLEPPVQGQPLKTGPEFETLPSQPELRVRLILRDPAALFAMQRQRQWLFGLLIGAATLAAGAGLVSARRAFQKQLRLAALKDNFVSSVSHELRAPVASLRLMSESLETRKVADPARQQEYFRLMSQECRRLSSLISNVLDFSRIEQGRKDYEFEPTDLRALVRDTVSVMQPNAEERQVRLALLLPAAPNLNGGAQATLDGKAMQQALINLVDNALKHSPPRAVVTIGLESDPDSGTSGGVCLWVEDAGPGIPVEEQQKIFDRYYRLGSELRRETQGIGIGLSIVKHIVDAHGGRVSVRSAPGQGSRFTLHLPREPIAANPVHTHDVS